MTELAYVQVGKAWSIARHVLDGFEWWCGEKDEWVSPRSSWWALDRACESETFKTLAAARRFARSRGWEKP
jgi:hypothetical protein